MEKTHTIPKPDLPLAAGISVVVPVYNSEQTLDLLLERLATVMGIASPGAFEVILINDASRDASWTVIGRLSARYAWLRGIDLMRNYGQHNALLCGIRAARFDKIVTLDDDLQNPPEEIPVLLSRLEEGLDVVYGKPQELQHGLLRNLASWMTKAVLKKAMGAQTARNISAFRVFRTRLRNAFADYRAPYVSIDVLLTWGTSHFDAVKVNHESRAMGASNYTLKKLLTHAANMMTGFSTWPLRLASLTGFSFTMLGVFLLAWVLGAYIIYGTQVRGFTFIASVIVIFSGAQLFALGIMGEYLARMHLRMMERPTYTVSQKLNFEGQINE